METGTTDARAGEAFLEALRRKVGLVFSKNEVVISERMNIGDSVVCTVEARKVSGESSQATGKAYVYHDLVVVCIESVCQKWREPIFPHHYEYLSY